MDSPGSTPDGMQASLISGQLMEVNDGKLTGGQPSMASVGSESVWTTRPIQTVVPKEVDVVGDCRGRPLIVLNPSNDRSGVDSCHGVPWSVFEAVPVRDAWPKVTRCPSCGDKAMGGFVDHPFDVVWREANLRWVGK